MENSKKLDDKLIMETLNYLTKKPYSEVNSLLRRWESVLVSDKGEQDDKTQEPVNNQE